MRSITFIPLTSPVLQFLMILPQIHKPVKLCLAKSWHHSSPSGIATHFTLQCNLHDRFKGSSQIFNRYHGFTQQEQSGHSVKADHSYIQLESRAWSTVVLRHRSNLTFIFSKIEKTFLYFKCSCLYASVYISIYISNGINLSIVQLKPCLSYNTMH